MRSPKRVQQAIVQLLLSSAALVVGGYWCRSWLLSFDLRSDWQKHGWSLVYYSSLGDEGTLRLRGLGADGVGRLLPRFGGIDLSKSAGFDLSGDSSRLVWIDASVRDETVLRLVEPTEQRATAWAVPAHWRVAQPIFDRDGTVLFLANVAGESTDISRHGVRAELDVFTLWRMAFAADGTAEVARVAIEGASQGVMALSGSGDVLVWQGLDDRLHRFRRAAGGAFTGDTPLTSEGSFLDALSPDGSWLAFSRGGDEHFRLELANPGAVTPLRSPSARGPTYLGPVTPDGKWIFCVSYPMYSRDQWWAIRVADGRSVDVNVSGDPQYDKGTSAQLVKVSSPR